MAPAVAAVLLGGGGLIGEQRPRRDVGGRAQPDDGGTVGTGRQCRAPVPAHLRGAARSGAPPPTSRAVQPVEGRPSSARPDPPKRSAGPRPRGRQWRRRPATPGGLHPSWDGGRSVVEAHALPRRYQCISALLGRPPRVRGRPRPGERTGGEDGVQVVPDSTACRSTATRGSALLITAMSSMSIAVAMQTTASVVPGRAAERRNRMAPRMSVDARQPGSGRLRRTCRPVARVLEAGLLGPGSTHLSRRAR